MKTTILASAALFLAPIAAQAQTAPSTPVEAADAPIDPTRLAAATRAVAALVPPGTYMRMMRDQFPKLMDGMMSQMGGMSAADLGGEADGKTLAQMAEAEDPHFRERMSIMTRVFSEELGTVFTEMEPDLRAGLSRAFARKFTLVQLNDLNTFFATPSGTAFAAEYLSTFMDPEVLKQMMSMTPRMMQAMAGIEAKVEKATAHLPPPPKTTADTKPRKARR